MKRLVEVIVLFLFVCTIQANVDDCIFTVGGNQYDLSSLKKGIKAPDSRVPSYTYEVSICGNNPKACDDIMTGKEEYGNAYLIGGTGAKPICWSVLSYWDGSQTVSPLSSDFGDDGLTFYFKNGDNCRNDPRKTEINMICDSNESAVGYQSSYDSCTFIVEWRTPTACKGSPGPTPPAWGFNGTFSGDLTCLTTNSTLCPFKNSIVQLRGNCDKAKLVIMDKNLEVFDVNFNECSGYSAVGKIESIEQETYDFALGYSDVNDKWVLLARADDPPYRLVFAIDLEDMSDEPLLGHNKLLN